MYDIIREKNSELIACGKKSRALSKWLRQSDLWHWFYSMQRIKGEAIGKRDIADIFGGKIVESAPLEAYAAASGLVRVQKDMENCIGLGSRPDVKMMLRWTETLTGKMPQFRSDSPIVYEWEHITPHSKSVSAALGNLLRRANLKKGIDPPTVYASKLHLEFLRLYPFGRVSVQAGLLLLMYTLMQEGLPLPSLNVSDREYNALAARYMAGGGHTAFTNMLEKSLVQRLDSALLLCRNKR